MTSPSRRFAELSRAQVRERCSGASVAILPVGAVEQHGPHLPLITDALVAEAASAAAVDSYGEALDLWLLPTLGYGRSVEHEWSPGTLSLSTGTFAAVLADLGRSVATAGIRRLVLVNGHGGNSSEIQTMLRDLRRAHGLMTFAVNAFPPPEEDPFAGIEQGQGIHGGAGETSLMLHLRPDLVDMGAAAPRLPRGLNKNTHVRFGGSVSFGWLSDDFGPDGYLGDPTQATADAGRRAFDAMTAQLGEQLDEIARFDFTNHLAGPAF
ncbi:MULTISPECIES: creatininase family protein [unclassified Streptomyces]|uniref:creatininase family protein n=1 Tax=unclassified Streptomyces TaxID=2593676 RepID=UPI00225ABFAC|nr:MULTISPECIES: creatininase family protein [unclassified Streptomyces]MCX4832286.1 creatininase family protein [Streptomyces sp. NBC_01016]